MDSEQINKRLFFWYSILWILLIIAIYLAYCVYFINTTSTKSKWVILFSSAMSILYCACKFLEISYYKQSDKLKNIFKSAIASNLLFFLFRDIIVIFFIITFIFLLKTRLAIMPAVSFVSGALLSLITSNISNFICQYGKIKSQDDDLKNINILMKINYSSISASVFLYWGVLCGTLVILFHISKDYETLLAYTFGFCCCAFLKNTICTVLENSIDNIKKIIKKTNKFDINNPCMIANNIVLGNNFSESFEMYAIILACAVATGANTLGLMGAFLPFILSANSMFTSLIVALISKNNKANNISKHFLRKTIFVSLAIVAMAFIEVYLWLGIDFYPISCSVLIGALFGILSILVFKNKNNSQEFKKQKNYFANISLNLGIIIILFLAAFFISDGMRYVNFAFYNIIISALSFCSTIAFVDILNQDEKPKYNPKNYLKNLNILVIMVSIITFGLVFELEEADILNPFVTISFFIGAMTSYLIIFFILDKIIKTSKQLAILNKMYTQEKKLTFKRNVFQFTVTASVLIILILAFLCGLMYLIKFYLGKDILLSFFTGLSLLSVPVLYNNNPYISSLSGAVIRICSAILLGLSILFL